MSSTLPSPVDDYAAPARLLVNRAVWNAVFGSLGQRLRALEAMQADFESLINLGTGQALEMIAANVEPQLAAARAALTQLQADAAAAEDIVAAIVSGSVPMTAVTGLATALAGKATPADVTAAIDALKGSAPAAYDTLVEIAAALAADQSAVAAITAQLTAASILAKVLTVDGTGSGLDADLVRGTTPGTFGLVLLAAATAAAARTALDLGTAATEDVGTFPNNLVQLTAAGKILTALLDTGTGAGQVVALDASGRYPAADGSLITGVPSLGVGQTWQSVSRSSGGTYQNTTGKPIVVEAVLVANELAAGGGISLSANNSTWTGVAYVAPLQAGASDTLSAVVPAGWYYRVTCGSGSMSVFELR